MLDFEKEKMVKVAALKNLSNVLKMCGENQKQEQSAREQKDGLETHELALEKVASPSWFSTGSLWHTASAQPLHIHFVTLKSVTALLFSLGIVASLGHHSSAVRARHQILPVLQPLPS